MWEERKIETYLRKGLSKKANAKNALLYSHYIQAREILCRDIYPEIKKVEPGLNYHDESHIANVLDNIYSLTHENISKLTIVEVYFLCLSALFHDVGVILGRENHQHKIDEVFDHVRGKNYEFLNEKRILRTIVASHCGTAIDSSHDTLNFVGIMHAYSEPVRAQELAAVLRFADELAEGGQRTSAFLDKKNAYPEGSKIYHKYSRIFEVSIECMSPRIPVNINISLDVVDGQLFFDSEISLQNMLGFIYGKLTKLDQERRYCKHYSELLSYYKEISVQISFWVDSNLLTLGLDPIIMSDKTVPGDSISSIEERFPNYAISRLSEMLDGHVNGGTK